MARSIRSLFRLNLGLPRNSVTRDTYVNAKRFLYTEQVLGIPGYEKVRGNFHHQFVNVENTFRTKMKEICEDENSMVFTEDLKAMLHLIEKKPEDLELVMKMMKKFNGQNKELRFGTYVFGPVVMRTFYTLNEPDLALSAFNDPAMENFFDQFISYQILMCLLLKNDKYSEMRDVYDKVQQKVLHGVAHPRKPMLLAMAACYKENTPETLEYALNIYREASSKGINFMRRSITFISALAINQNAPHIALELLSSLVKTTRYIDVRCLKVIACAHLNRFTEVVPILRQSLESDRPHRRKETYFIDVIEKLEQEMKRQGVSESDELSKLVYQLRLNDHIIQTTLNEHLLKPIDEVRLPEGSSNSSSFSTQDGFPSRRVRETRPRSNLRDLL